MISAELVNNITKKNASKYIALVSSQINEIKSLYRGDAEIFWLVKNVINDLDKLHCELLRKRADTHASTEF